MPRTNFIVSLIQSQNIIDVAGSEPYEEAGVRWLRSWARKVGLLLGFIFYSESNACLADSKIRVERNVQSSQLTILNLSGTEEFIFLSFRNTFHPPLCHTFLTKDNNAFRSFEANLSIYKTLSRLEPPKAHAVNCPGTVGIFHTEMFVGAVRACSLRPQQNSHIWLSLAAN